MLLMLSHNHRTLARLNPRGNDICLEMDAAIPDTHPGMHWYYNRILLRGWQMCFGKMNRIDN